MQKDIDIVIYGATGFTGQLCVKYFQSLDLEINWAIAGRNLEKLQGVANSLATNVEILVADSDDEDVDDTIPLDKDKFDKSGGTAGAATVGVGGVLVSTLAIPLPSIDCLLAILASGIVEGVSMLLPEA